MDDRKIVRVIVELDAEAVADSPVAWGHWKPGTAIEKVVTDEITSWLFDGNRWGGALTVVAACSLTLDAKATKRRRLARMRQEIAQQRARMAERIAEADRFEAAL